MADPAIIDRYFTALCSTDGALAASLFAPDGVIDDFRGGHRAGRAVIEEFIGSRPPRTLRLLGRPYVHGPRITVYTEMGGFPNGETRLVRFVFTASETQIQHLCNTIVEFVPEQFRTVGFDARYPVSSR